jgi:hypothetical protein
MIMSKSTAKLQKLFGTLFPGVGPADLARIQRPLKFTFREIEIAKANGPDFTSLLEPEPKFLRNLLNLMRWDGSRLILF